MNLSSGVIGKFKIAFPDKKEQDKISLFLDKRLIQFEEVERKVEHQIKKLTELKQILIAEAVTGKIKV